MSSDMRYARHLALPEVGAAGQARLQASSVLVVGLGGLGSAASMYLAASGVGRLVLNDCDVVDSTNLQRQLLYRDADVGQRKTVAATAMLAGINPDVQFVCHDGRLDAKGLDKVIRGVDVVLDCSDNFGTRFSLNSACVAAKSMLVSGAAVRLAGQVASFDLRSGGPCYACLFDERGETLENCEGNGILAPLVGVIGALQAVEAVRYIVGIGAPATGRLIRVSAKDLSITESRFDRDPACSVCT